MHEFEEARDKIMLGKESKTMILSDQDKRITAYHEGGHALVRLMMPDDTDPLHKVTIIPRGRALGVTHYLPEKEKYNRSKKELLANIASALGGRAAEELVFDEISTGAYSDFKAATEIARSMVCAYGMTDELGKMVYLDTYDGPAYSEKTFEKIDAKIAKILDEQYDIAFKLLKDNRDKLDKIAEILLEKETVYASELYELLGIEPRQNLKLV
jgi:cell division protease FtsH